MQVCLFLANLRGEAADSDAALRAFCGIYGALERCFVARNPAGDSKLYGFAEFTLPAAAAACRDAFNAAGDAQKRPREAGGWVGGSVGPHACFDAELSPRPLTGRARTHVPPCASPTVLLTCLSCAAAAAAAAAAGEPFQRVKLQRAEVAPVKTVGGLFARVLFVDGLQQVGHGSSLHG